MCHERWMRRRQKEAEEARDLWLDFERTTPIADPEPADAEQPRPMEAQAPDESVTADR